MRRCDAPARRLISRGPRLARLRAVKLNAANGDDTGLALGINDRTIPEVDISYFYTPNIAAERVLTYPQSQDIRAGGARIAGPKHLPPMLTLQYHFMPDGSLRPYVGAGIGCTHHSSVAFGPAVAAALGPGIGKDSYGFALQAGFDVPLANNLSFNVDVKKAQIRTDVASFGTKVGSFKVDPLPVGIGLGGASSGSGCRRVRRPGLWGGREYQAACGKMLGAMRAVDGGVSNLSSRRPHPCRARPSAARCRTAAPCRRNSGPAAIRAGWTARG